MVEMLYIRKYDESKKDKWDKFVLNESVNGTFLQTRAFLEYHGTRFNDESLFVYKGNDVIVAVIPACRINQDNKTIFSSHMGSTFGGMVISNTYYDLNNIEAVMETLEEYLKDNVYSDVVLKITGNLFSKRNNDLLYYFLFQRGYKSYDELSFYIDFEHYNEEIASNFSSPRRRGYRCALNNNMTFRNIETSAEIKAFYDVLCDNLKKFDAVPVHSFEEIMDLKENRIPNNVDFYAAFLGEEIVAGSMVFLFDNVFHTQYLAADQSRLKLFPMNFLDYNLIKTAKDSGYRFFSFGTSTTDHGRILNKHLAEFKEGFGTEYAINRTFYKSFKE